MYTCPTCYTKYPDNHRPPHSQCPTCNVPLVWTADVENTDNDHWQIVSDAIAAIEAAEKKRAPNPRLKRLREALLEAWSEETDRPW